MFDYFEILFQGWGLGETPSLLLADLSVLLLFLLAIMLSHLVARRLILPLIARIVAKTETDWDEVFYEHKVFHMLPHLVPVTLLSSFAFSSDKLNAFLGRAAAVYVLVLALLTVRRVFQAIESIYNRFDVSREKPIKTYLQVIFLILALMAGLIALALMFNRSPLTLLSGLGAMTAVLLLIFKDPISGFVSGIQLTVNQMIRLGDWIEMPDYKADGEVIEMTLTTLKVRNWDMTITTIPVYALTSGSFRNWRGMQESGGRRIKRSLLIDMRTVGFCSAAQLQQLQRIKLLQDYLPARQREIAAANTAAGFAPEQQVIGGRALTNIGVFREYALRYLQQHPGIHPDKIMMVRQLQSTEFGLPLEVYAFCADTAWVNYEGVQSDIFDHLIAMVPEFGLRLYQRSSDVGLIVAEGVRQP
ncbi:MAG: mechanosensitive ion channel [Candidatus Sericytochromatia bacterium]|nr:mechanosensitive ion channel [Candidatus Sericytochromatia bacterium]